MNGRQWFAVLLAAAGGLAMLLGALAYFVVGTIGQAVPI